MEIMSNHCDAKQGFNKRHVTQQLHIQIKLVFEY